ncbi:MAG: transcriptional coactivator p15/PC4 family protein [Leptospirales bacterium]|nr:transcriptional coactivator p15/PC4 family protein [Leptospirales bacterium]
MGIIRDIEKGGGEIIRVEITDFKGQKLLNLRIWYTDKESGEKKPTQKGIALKPELYAQLKQAVLEAESEIQNILSGG